MSFKVNNSVKSTILINGRILEQVSRFILLGYDVGSKFDKGNEKKVNRLQLETNEL